MKERRRRKKRGKRDEKSNWREKIYFLGVFRLKGFLDISEGEST